MSPKLHDFCVDIPITTSCDFLESRTELKWVVTANLKQQTYKQMNEWITKKAKTAAENPKKERKKERKNVNMTHVRTPNNLGS